MENSQCCHKCGNKNLILDDPTSSLVCSSCGTVQPFDDFQAHIGGINGPTGTFIRMGTTGSGNSYTYKETKIYKARTLMEDLLFKLNFSTSRSDEVKIMVESITEGEYGQGDWYRVFVGACAYVVMRKNKNPLPMGEVAAVVGCNIYELGRMVARVVDFDKLELPNFDIVNMFEKATRSCSAFIDVERDKVGRMLKQGVFLVQCLVKWFVTTGRRPIPVVAAVLVFVAKLNQVDVNIEDVAKELNVAVHTCRLRYKELLERLVDVARMLPWGKNITVKNIVNNAPFVIKYMEMKSMAKCQKERKFLPDVGFNMDEFVGDCLREGVDHLTDRSYGAENDSQYFEAERSHSWNAADLEKLKISHESLSLIYSKFLDEVHQPTLESRKENRRTRRQYDFLGCIEWWTGKSDMSKRLFLKQILEKDVGLNAMPPSFVSGCLAYQRRREKIEAAKLRIEKIACPSKENSGVMNYLCPSKCVKTGRKRRKLQVYIDWEDFIIETLLLHQVKEEEIEKGHYNTLLDLHVFNSGCV